MCSPGRQFYSDLISIWFDYKNNCINIINLMLCPSFVPPSSYMLLPRKDYWHKLTWIIIWTHHICTIVMFVTIDLHQLDIWYSLSQGEKTFFVSATQFGSAPKCHPVIQNLFPGSCYTLLPSVMENLAGVFFCAVLLKNKANGIENTTV